MKRFEIRSLALLVVLMSVVFVLTACGGGEALAGTYRCEEHWNEGFVGELSLEFRSDGTFSMIPIGGSGTYEVGNNVVTLTSEHVFPDGFDLQMEGDSLRAPSDLGDIVYVKQ